MNQSKYVKVRYDSLPDPMPKDLLKKTPSYLLRGIFGQGRLTVTIPFPIREHEKTKTFIFGVKH